MKKPNLKTAIAVAISLFIYTPWATVAHADNAPSGVWTDETGEFYLDLNQKTYNGYDDGCKITKMSSNGKGRFKLAMTCSSETVKPRRVSAFLKKRGKGWHLKFDKSYGSFDVNFSRKEGN